MSEARVTTGSVHRKLDEEEICRTPVEEDVRVLESGANRGNDTEETLTTRRLWERRANQPKGLANLRNRRSMRAFLV